jgi:hypothetical protein
MIVISRPKDFWDLCAKTDSCWYFNGRPPLIYLGHIIAAHRLSWELYHRKKLKSKVILVLHSCQNDACVNPKHLFIGTQQDIDSRRDSLEDFKTKFWSRVDKKGPVYKNLGRCWIWTGSRLKGYGQVHFREQRACLAHRASWFLAHGRLPKNVLICHKCDNPLCIRPSHLFQGTNKMNSEDMVAKGRHKGYKLKHPVSAETRAKISKAAKGNHRRLGAKLSEESKEKIRQAQLRHQAQKRKTRTGHSPAGPS